eukprot:5519439-Prymnesium_polylepis.1
MHTHDWYNPYVPFCTGQPRLGHTHMCRPFRDSVVACTRPTHIRPADTQSQQVLRDTVASGSQCPKTERRTRAVLIPASRRGVRSAARADGTRGAQAPRGNRPRRWPRCGRPGDTASRRARGEAAHA